MKLNGGKTIAPEQIVAGFKDVESAVSTMEECIQSMQKCVELSKLELEVERVVLGNIADANGEARFSMISSIDESILSCMRRNSLRLYENSSREPCFFIEKDEFPQSQWHEDLKDSVVIRLEEDGIYAKLPMLWSRNSRMVRDAKGQPLSYRHSHFFYNEIVSQIENNERFGSYDFSRFARKILHFLYVYATNPDGSGYAVDNDNHDTKSIQDALTMYLPNGDSPMSCFVFHSAIVSNAVPVGTYITVTSVEDGIKDADKIIQRWVQFPG